MYAKIYRELFIKNYTLKKHIRDNIWVVKLGNEDFYISVYEDTEIVCGFNNYNEAELLKYKDVEDVELRIKKNREFYEAIKKFKKTNSYLFRSKNLEQPCLFNYDNYIVV